MNPKNRNRLVVAIGILVFTAITAGLLYRGSGSAGDALPEPAVIAVATAWPQADTLAEPIRYLGTVEGAQDAVLGFRAAGPIARIHVREGQPVAAGALLAELALPEMSARVSRAGMELVRADANLRHWQNELAIDERLVEKGAVSRSRLEQTRLAFENARAVRDAAGAAVEEARAAAQTAELRAPMAGVVTRIDRASGETVMPGQPVIQLSAGVRQVRADVLSKDLGRGVGPGTAASLSAGGCERAPARVARVESATRQPFQSVRVYLEAEACLDRLSVGTTVNVDFQLPAAGEGFLLPPSAVDLRAGTPRVFRIVSGERVEAVPVELGAQKETWQQVRGALNAADRIVVSGTNNLQPGDKVHQTRDAL